MIEIKNCMDCAYCYKKDMSGNWAYSDYWYYCEKNNKRLPKKNPDLISSPPKDIPDWCPIAKNDLKKAGTFCPECFDGMTTGNFCKNCGRRLL